MSCCFGAKRIKKNLQRTERSIKYDTNQHESESYYSRQQEGRKHQSQANKKSKIEVIEAKSKQIALQQSKLKVSILREYEGKSVNKMRQSKLIEDINMMDFRMDTDNGISHTPFINTFRYDSILSQHILSNRPSSSIQQGREQEEVQ